MVEERKNFVEKIRAVPDRSFPLPLHLPGIREWDECLNRDLKRERVVP
jgi:hypothetical protein